MGFFFLVEVSDSIFIIFWRLYCTSEGSRSPTSHSQRHHDKIRQQSKFKGCITMKILVTGFEPFGGQALNPSWMAVNGLPKEINGATIDVLQIPTAFFRAVDKIEEKLEQEHYDVVLAVGQAGGRHAVTPERVGINLDDASIPDNLDKQPIDEMIHKDGANAYFTNLPIKRMVDAIRTHDIPSAVSNSAGTFVCNHVLYSLGYLQDKKYPNLKFGFIHVPFMHDQVEDNKYPSLSLVELVIALKAAIRVITEHTDDIREPYGTTH